MSRFRRKPNPNRNYPTHCPYCASTDLFPDEEGDFAWACQECLRVFSVLFHGQDDAPTAPAPALSTEEALARSLERRGITLRDPAGSSASRAGACAAETAQAAQAAQTAEAVQVTAASPAPQSALATNATKAAERAEVLS